MGDGINLNSAAGAWAQKVYDRIENPENGGGLAPEQKNQLKSEFEALGGSQDEAFRDLDAIVAANKGTATYPDTDARTIASLKADLAPKSSSSFFSDAFETVKSKARAVSGLASQGAAALPGSGARVSKEMDENINKATGGQ